MSGPEIRGADGQPWRPLREGGDALPETRGKPELRPGEWNDLRDPAPEGENR